MSHKRILLIAAVIAAAYVAIVVTSGAGWNPFDISWNFANSGAFGDSFGPLSSLMAGIAAVAAILAYRGQAEELERLKEEAENDRKERTKRDFELTFFNMLELFRETVKEIEIEDRYNQNPRAGRDGLKLLLETHIHSSTGTAQGDRQLYQKNYLRFRDDLAHYFRLFYHILKFIDDSRVPSKKTYTRILRATLSNAEIVLIALNCMYGGGRPKLKKLVEKYSMLHNISSGDFSLWRMDKEFSSRAIGDRGQLSNGELSEA